MFKLALKQDVEKVVDANHKGCEHCNKGYKGRIAIQEVLEIDDDIRNTLNSSSVEKEELKKLVYGSGNVITLLQDGLRKVLEKITTFEEIYRIIEIDNDINDSCYETLAENVTEAERIEIDKERSRELHNLKRLETDANAKVVNIKETTSIVNTQQKPESTTPQTEQKPESTTPQTEQKPTAIPPTQSNQTVMPAKEEANVAKANQAKAPIVPPTPVQTIKEQEKQTATVIAPPSSIIPPQAPTQTAAPQTVPMPILPQIK